MTEASGQTTDAPSWRFRPYPEYRDSGVEWLGGIPAHWGTGTALASVQRDERRHPHERKS